ncbi:mevalonate kinase [Virgibacillus soli]|uniref:mevalonate kinase n=2 Tax=Lederbergia galactosidilytica TaxID=217031 RepID=A0A177ZN38_9BACI|nr:mevalonate kinase [Virgibacillus soli]OAK69174.1 mevalonate kinase [Lederbergia galactosidilytica]
MTTQKKTAIGRAHSKIILIGEHAVVYGKPAIALPFPSLEVVSSVKEISGDLFLTCRYFVGKLEEAPKDLKGIATCITETLKNLKQPAKGLQIKIDSSVPIGRGLGSSASSAIAVVKSLYQYFEQKLSKTKLLELVHISETYAHGNPSGIDMVAASSSHPLWFERDGETYPVKIKSPLHLVVADTGRIGETLEAVESIRKNSLLSPIKVRHSIDLLGDYTLRTKEALAEGNSLLVGSMMDAAHNELKKLGVSDTELDHLVQIAKERGALGAKLTGGGKGGCMIALASSLEHAKDLAGALLQNGAAQAWSYIIE